MKVDTENSAYQEAPEPDDPDERFSRKEKRSLRVLLRRLRFLETKIRENGGLQAAGANSGGAAFAEWEAEALEFVLTEIGFLAPVDDRKRP